MNDLEKKVKIISTKRLKADLLNKYSVLNGAKYFSSDRLQNYLVSVSTNRIEYISNDSDKTELSSSIGMSKNLLKIHIIQAFSLLQN